VAHRPTIAARAKRAQHELAGRRINQPSSFVLASAKTSWRRRRTNRPSSLVLATPKRAGGGGVPADHLLCARERKNELAAAAYQPSIFVCARERENELATAAHKPPVFFCPLRAHFARLPPPPPSYALALAHQFEARAETSLSLTRSTVVAGDPQWARSSLSTYLHAPHHVLMMFAARCLPHWALSLAIHVGLHILWGAGQVEILSSEEMKKMIANFAEGARFKGDSFDAFADDIVLERANDWGFELEDIKSPVRVLHSPGDKIVPFAAGVENADRLPNGVLVDMGGEWSLYSEGHLIMEEYWGQIMDWAVSLEELGGPVKKVEKEEENVNTHDEF
jgi:pimeloyl-ACP methyl ester carboxylesterase